MGQLARALKWTGPVQDLESLGTVHDYEVWTSDGRVIQAARPKLRKVQARVAVLLRRVLPPDYRQSGVRKRSALTNAMMHREPHPSIKLDIKSFYPSTTFALVLKFFRNSLGCAGDVAYLLAKVCCFDRKHLPTGGVHSEVLAFYCHKGSFDRLHERSAARGGVMTVYVDDILVTMPCASLADLEWARRLFRQQSTTLHPGKSRVIRKRERKVITGVEIRRGHLAAPQEQHLKIKTVTQSLQAAPAPDEQAALARKLLGHYDHIAQIEPSRAEKARGSRARLKPFLK